MASMAYSEQVGVKRQAGGKRGETRSWYALIRERKKTVVHFCRKCFINSFLSASGSSGEIVFLNWRRERPQARCGNNGVLVLSRRPTASATSCGLFRLKP